MMWRDGRRDDERCNTAQGDLAGYRHQGSFEIAAPEALYAVGFGRKLQKNPPRASAGCAGRPRYGYTIDGDEERTREETNSPLKRVRSKVIGIDEISIRKGHTYRIVVSDLERHRPIWFGGEDRSEASMDEFYRFIGEKKARKIRLAVMDMWKPFRNSTTRNAPQAAALFDKFHVMRHLGEALDKVRKHDYARLDGKSRTFSKGQKYALLSHPQNLKGPARKILKLLLAANKRLNTAYVLKESFGQLWDYTSEAWARKFFDNWRAQLKWQRLEPYARFADMIERHWDGLAAYCRPENKVSLGFVEGLNNKIRVLQRRAYGLRDAEYLRLKVLTCMLPKH
jgi:transposase